MKKEVTETKDQKTEVKSKKSSYSKKKKGKEEYSEWYRLRTVYF